MYSDSMADEKESEDEKKKKLYEKPEVLFAWDGPARVHVERDSRYFTTLFIGAIVISFVLVLFKQYSLMLVVLALAFSIYSLNRFSPKTVHYQILNDSVKIDDDQYYYGDLGVFWFAEMADHTVLKIATYLNFPRRIEMIINPADRDGIEDRLLHYIPYQEVKDGRIHSFIEQLVVPGAKKAASKNS